MAGLLHAAKLYVIQQAVKETQQLTTLTQLQLALLRLQHLYYNHIYGIPDPNSVLQKFTSLAAKMTNTHVGNTQGPSPQEQLDK